MSRHARGILYHSLAGAISIVLLIAAFPGVLRWKRPAFFRSYSIFQSSVEALDRARQKNDIATMLLFYAPEFRFVELELPSGEVRRLRVRPYLEQIAKQGTILSAETIGPEDAYQHVRVRTPAFDLTLAEGNQARYRQEWTFSWDGSAWKIVKHRLTPAE